MNNFNKILQLFANDPLHMAVFSKLLAACACFISLGTAAYFTQLLELNEAAPILIASMGASAVILFIIPNSPLAQPWPFVGGHLISAIIGIASTQIISDVATSGAVAVSVSVLLMLFLRCLHPPGAATALAPTMMGQSLTSLGYGFVLLPVAINVSIMLLLAIILNRWLLKHRYPVFDTGGAPKTAGNIPQKVNGVGVSKENIKQALDSVGMFIDVTPEDLHKVFLEVEMLDFKRVRGNITCGDIMKTGVDTVDYGTEVEEAWRLMHKKNLKAVPVVDRAGFVLGIVTWNDFFKHIDLSPFDNFQKTFRCFILRTAGMMADKPEVIGHLMTSSVTTIKASEHIVKLIPLMTLQGRRQIPVVNEDNRFVGMLNQADLIAALFNEQRFNQEG